MTNIDAKKILMFMLNRHGYASIVSSKHEDSYFLYAAKDEDYAAICKISIIRPYMQKHPGREYSTLEQITSKSNNYSGVLESLLDACKSNDIYINDNKFTRLLKKGTTLESILISKDLESSENDK